ncbi:MAG: hypothetical protein ACRC1M_06775 [Methanobacteriaceae archaeon]
MSNLFYKKIKLLYKYYGKKTITLIYNLEYNINMKLNNRSVVKIGEYDLYERKSRKGWAIIIMPIGIRIDNFHGFPHIHFSQNGIKHEINTNDFNEAYEIVFKHILTNNKINKGKLREELQ